MLPLDPAQFPPPFAAALLRGPGAAGQEGAGLRQVRQIRERSGTAFRIIVGGNAFLKNPALAQELGADLHLSTFDDIRRLSEAK